jgi:uncharacterized protein (DUF58 family)
MTSPEAPGVLDPEVARRVKNLGLVARRAVDGLLSGVHRSPHRGASVVFVEHREYRQGDDPRLLDWRAFARTDRDVVKRFEQETQLRATLVLDRSGSMGYRASHGPSKAEHAATLLAALAYVLVGQGDAAGAVTITDDITRAVPPRTRPQHLDAILEALAEWPTRGSRTDLRTALTSVAERAGRRGVVAIASDLLDLADDALSPITHLVGRGHDVVVLHVMHPDEIDPPFHGPVRVRGLENEAPLDVDMDAVRAGYRREIDAFLARSRDRCLEAGARYALARTDERPEHTLGAILTASRRRGFR